MAVIPFTNPERSGVAGAPVFPSGAKAITKSDTDTFDHPVAIYVGVTGDVAVMPSNGSAAVTFAAVPAGAMVPCMVVAVKSTGTTASSLVAVY